MKRPLIRPAHVRVLAALCLAAPCLAAPSLTGCAYFGAAAGIVARAIPKPVDAAYKGLAGQKVVLMVWADRAVRTDNPELTTEVSAAVQDKLINLQKSEKPDAMAGMTFPFSSAVVERNQADHPEWENLPVEEVATKLNCTRLIYIEVSDFTTRSAASLELFRGAMTGRLRVVETADDGHGHVTGKVAYDGGDVSVVFPKDSPKDGLPNRDEAKMSLGTIDAFGDEVAKRFYKHNEDRD